MILDPSQYASTSSYDLLRSAALGHIGFDHRLVHVLTDNPEETLDGILRFALEKVSHRGEDELEMAEEEARDDERIDLEDDLIALVRHLRTPKALPFLIELVRKTKDDVPETVIEAFAETGAPAVEPLIALYHELGKAHGGEVAFALAALPVRDSRILSLLLERLQSDPDDAVLCLALHGDAGAIPSLQAFLATLDSTADPHSSLRHETEQAIQKLSSGETLAIEAFDIWSQYPEEAGPWFEVLSDDECFLLLDSKVPEYRAHAAAAFVLEELPEEVEGKLFEMAKRDSDPLVRANCWEALSGALSNKKVHDAMLAKLADAQAPLEERCGALLGLAQNAKDPKVSHWMQEFYKRPETRMRALEAMWRSLDQRFAKHFSRHLDDPDLEVRRQAVLGVGYLGIGSDADKLRKLFYNQDLRADALYAYSLSAPVEVTPETIRLLFEQIDDFAGLGTEEAILVQSALDDRLAISGYEPVFGDGEDHEHEHSHPHSHH